MYADRRLAVISELLRIVVPGTYSNIDKKFPQWGVPYRAFCLVGGTIMLQAWAQEQGAESNRSFTEQV